MADSDGPEHFVGAYVATRVLDNDALLSQWFILGTTVDASIEAAGVGELDGHVDGGDEQAFFAYGPDADAMFRVMEPQLRAFPACSCSGGGSRSRSAHHADVRAGGRQ